jgi:O-antigen ligase
MSGVVGDLKQADVWGESLGAAPALGRRALLGCLLAALFAMANGIWALSLEEGFTGEVEEVESRVSDGSAGRRVAFLTLGALGCAGLVASGARLQPRGGLALALGGLAFWALASTAWSVDPGLTLRRLFVFAMCALAALAGARRYSAAQLAWLALFAAGAHLLIDIVAAAAHGTFRPWEFGFRFAGTLHPNHEAGLCALLLSAAAGLAWAKPALRRQLLGAAAVAGGLLLLTKSRTNLAASAAALGVMALFCGGRRFVLIACLGLGAVVPVAAVFLDAGDALQNFEKMLGRSDTAEVTSLTGRLPLWQDLTPSIAARPVTGHGFGAFWSPERILALADAQGWAISHAHSDYIDLLLALGVPGLLCYVAVMSLGLAAALRAAQRSTAPDSGGYLAMAGWIVFLIVGGLTEQVGLQPSLPVFFALCGLTHLACRAEADDATDAQRYAGGLHP